MTTNKALSQNSEIIPAVLNGSEVEYFDTCTGKWVTENFNPYVKWRIKSEDDIERRDPDFIENRLETGRK